MGCKNLAAGLPTIDDIRPSEGLDTISSGGDPAGASRRFAAEIAGAIRDHVPAIDRIAIGRFSWRAVDALRAEGLTVTDADAALLPARAIKLIASAAYLQLSAARLHMHDASQTLFRWYGDDVIEGARSSHAAAW